MASRRPTMFLLCRRLKHRFFVWPLVAFIFIFLYFQVTFPVRYIFKHSNVNSSCVIPKLDPFDPSILKFVWEPKPLSCDTTLPIVYSDTGSIVKFNESSMQALHLSKKEVSCTYRKIVRNTDDTSVKFSQVEKFTPPFRIDADFFHVTCYKQSDIVIYDQLLTGASQKYVERKVPVQDESLDQMSVLMFGLDSVSRSAAIRKMPKTLRYLKELGSFDFKGYMKVCCHFLEVYWGKKSVYLIWKCPFTLNKEGKKLL